jgi:hypothetical protein
MKPYKPVGQWLDGSPFNQDSRDTWEIGTASNKNLRYEDIYCPDIAGHLK